MFKNGLLLEFPVTHGHAVGQILQIPGASSRRAGFPRRVVSSPRCVGSAAMDCCHSGLTKAAKVRESSRKSVIVFSSGENPAPITRWRSLKEALSLSFTALKEVGSLGAASLDTWGGSPRADHCQLILLVKQPSSSLRWILTSTCSGTSARPRPPTCRGAVAGSGRQGSRPVPGGRSVSPLFSPCRSPHLVTLTRGTSVLFK